MPTPRIGVLSVQGGFAEHTDMLRNLGADPTPVRRLDHLQRLDGLVIPGGESTTISRLLDLSGMLEPLREAIAAGLPTFGTCAGLIMLSTDVLDTRPDAHSLGALDISVRRNAFGRQVNSFETTLNMAHVAEDTEAVFIRAPRVERVGESVEELATLPDGTVVAVQSGVVLGTSFHPELTGDDRIHRYFLSLVEQSR
ncbi:pyridoxal 5'-phosphate synthase glutaminase subunit PdxT [Corynebacterium heidelbergense]|uniref:Pyridoxal 5'-phosphate synthase subunit PdxT n=1 Tax=Corynebacterium heidelbergense TaxID=2055947 RepID=A0A364VD62_9CORY|nr:pyridoxal 5'-phosphate synthase glutaminase subunit PdxT [Corynebacterium heidelbergense]RAV34595.1 pyridoxal 5'-phosphate synthase glutaminase subunit PdxT [Corynebacterium heidelbergense]WCZ36634.1 Glutamine amidotransferase subunit PdxT [Corynebacterium heidelbergense]